MLKKNGEFSREWSWDRDEDSTRKAFEQKRILSDQMNHDATFGAGAIVLNHMVSAIDALYLMRIGSKKKLSVQLWVPSEMVGDGYSFSVHF